jgi:HEAT repeat protein
VRASVATALGARRVARAAPALRERLENKDEKVEVRRAAASALAALCDQNSVGTLTDLAKRLADPMATVEERALAESALAALAAISPSDLQTRLAPLATTRAAAAAKGALSSAALRKTCGQR